MLSIPSIIYPSKKIIPYLGAEHAKAPGNFFDQELCTVYLYTIEIYCLLLSRDYMCAELISP